MDDGERGTDYEVHNRNLIRSEEHLSISVDNDRSNLDALNESQNLKIDSSNSNQTTTKSDRIYSGLSGDPRLQQWTTLKNNQRKNCTKFVIKNSQKITEQKNEILSRTLQSIAIQKLFKYIFYCIIILLICNSQFGVESAPSNREISLSGNYGRGGVRKSSRSDQTAWKRGHRHGKNMNKNCKEYDVTSRAFSSHLIFEGKVRTKGALGQYITFNIQKVLKPRRSSLKPKTQIRVHFERLKRSLNHSRSNFFSDCLKQSIPNNEIDMRLKLKFGTNYIVFADLSGPMNYTAVGDPIVANKRNLKSILSVISTDREKPPRVRGLQDQNLKVNGELRLICRIKGTPVPRINWFKDGVPLIPSTHVNVTYYRKNSTIEIKSLKMEDGGRYECKATSITGKTANISAYVNVSEYYRETTEDPEWRFRTVKCQVDSYCLNGGKCEFLENLGEHMCRCKSGYVGARCENKELSTLGTRSYVCGFNVGYSSFYC